MKTRFVGLCAAVLFSVAATAALAQSTPAPSSTPVALPTVPPSTNPMIQSIINAAIGSVASSVKAGYGWEQNRAIGTVTFFKRFDMQVRFANGQYRTVHLHQGTVINPRGTSIQAGQNIDVRGQGVADGSLNADSIIVH